MNCDECGKRLGGTAPTCFECSGAPVSLDEARRKGVTLTKLRVGCSAWRWQSLIVPHDKIRWEQMGTKLGV